MLYDDKNWSTRYFPIMHTEQGFRNLREWARKRAMEIAVKKYFDGMEGAKNLRLYGERRQKPISNQVYQALVTSHKTELRRSLSHLLRKGDTIPIPPQD
jgi:hypothetical protein